VSAFISILVCFDCLITSANGFEIGLQSDEDFEKFRARYMAAEVRYGHLIAECSDPDHSGSERDGYGVCDDEFSMRRCEWCGTNLAGSRHCATMDKG
jgi:hypothetical protein